MTLPLVSVIIPVFNCEKYVYDTIVSVINQSYTNIELIVVDDGSTDNSLAEIRKALALQEFTLVLQSNQGLVATLTHIRKIAKGKYLSVLGCDDLWENKRLEKLIGYAEKNQYAMVFSNCKYINENGKSIGVSKIKFTELSTFEFLLQGKLSIPSPSVMVLREIYNSFDYPSNYIEDFPMWLSISKNNKVGFLNDILCSYRIHSNSMSKRFEVMMNEERKIISQYECESNYENILIFWQLRWIKCKLKYLNNFDHLIFCSLLKSINVYLRRDFYVIIFYILKRFIK
ncbi:hypothetical protein A9259_16765 [Vibrio cyclitrophicus]|uniref:glycosyltransferase family 2 protein n=1 Tax=Vibrio cyclitrophicus TaxID=47951 RepID=UPI0007EEA9B6|nr:glycosyltransferase [Vibrio cyclitrophicus]OBS93543.1 hypothetical protein A9259_16765 [Vibrio cyclitrophicus]